MQLRSVTKSAVAFIGTVTALLQVPEIQQLAKSAVLHHPHLTTLLSGLLVIVSLVHNPQVIEALGLKTQTVVQTSEVVPLQQPVSPAQEKS